MDTNDNKVLVFLDDLPVSPKAKVLMLHILRRAGESNDGSCNESLRRIAPQIGMVFRTVFVAKMELEEAGLIRVEKQRSRKADKLFVSLLPESKRGD